MTTWIRWFDDIGMDDVPVVGGKNASLGEMRRALTPLGIRTPDGFATTADAYRAFLRAAGLEALIEETLGHLDVSDIRALQAAGTRVRSAVLAGRLPEALVQSVTEAYRRMEAQHGASCDVAVRSSATAEDLPEASFAGQQETYLNIHGAAMLIDAVRRCYASLFTDRAIVYRVHHGFDHAEVALSVGIQKMVRSDLASAGVMFSIDTETGFANAVLINGAYGLGESVVQGTVNPDEFYVFKPTLATGHRPILQKKLGTKEFKLVYEDGGTRQTRSVPVAADDRDRFVLPDDDILTLARWAATVENHYSQLRGTPTPMDIEWAKDGRSGELFLVQARPETVHARRNPLVLERYRLERRGEVIATGRSVGGKIGQGLARVIRSAADLEQLQAGEVLVTEMTDPDWEPVMKRAAAIVTDRGGRTCHAAIVSRELGIPAIVGTGTGTSSIASGEAVTVSCAEGEAGFVYRGRLPVHIDRTDLTDLPRPRTAMMMNVANPAEAFSLSHAAQRRRRPGAARVHHQQSRTGAPDGAAAPRPGRRSERAAGDRAAHARLRRQGAVLRRPAGRGRRDDCRRLLAEGRHRADVGLQDQRIRRAARRRGLRAQGGEPDAGVPRRLALLRPALPRRLRPRVPRHAEGPRGDGSGERQADGAVLPDRRGRTTGDRGDGRQRAGAGGTRARGLRDVRDSEQRDAGPRVRRGVRRLLHRQQRPHAAGARASIATRSSSRTSSTSATKR